MLPLDYLSLWLGFEFCGRMKLFTRFLDFDGGRFGMGGERSFARFFEGHFGVDDAGMGLGEPFARFLDF